VQRLAAQVEEAVAEANVLGIVGLAEDRQRQFQRLRQHLERRHLNFDLAGAQIGVHRLGRTGHDPALDFDDPLRAQLLGHAESGCVIRIEDELRQPVIVPEVDEKQAAMVALAVDPAGQPDALADMRLTELATGVAAIEVHLYKALIIQNESPQRNGMLRPDGRKRMEEPGLSRVGQVCWVAWCSTLGRGPDGRQWTGLMEAPLSRRDRAAGMGYRGAP